MSIKEIISNIFPDGRFDSIPKKDIVKPQKSIKQVFSPMSDIGYKLDKAQEELFDLIENTHTNVFIQGQAGTGKSTFINYLKKYSDKRIRIVCPTAVAAINIGGTTIYSLFNLQLSDFLSLIRYQKNPERS